MSQVSGGKLTMTAQGNADTVEAVYRKTMVRSLDLPEQADPKAMTHSLIDGILTIEMPLVLAPKARPPNPGVVPIITADGRRKIFLQLMIGADFTMDDLQVRRPTLKEQLVPNFNVFP